MRAPRRQAGSGRRQSSPSSPARRCWLQPFPHFWQNFPKAIESDGESLVIRLFPAQYADLHELQGGEQRTHELYLAFGPDRLSAHGLEWCRSRTIAGVEPAWCLSSEAVPFLAPLDAGHAELVESAIEGADRFEHKREVIDEYGWRHFGDIYGDHEAVPHDKPTPLVSHYNNQYDPIAGFACQWLRTGDPRWWIAMSELASHVIDIDVYHTAEDKAATTTGSSGTPITTAMPTLRPIAAIRAAVSTTFMAVDRQRGTTTRVAWPCITS